MSEPAGAAFQWLGVGVGCVAALLIFLLGIAVIVQMFDGRINLSKLVSEENGELPACRDSSF